MIYSFSKIRRIIFISLFIMIVAITALYFYFFHILSRDLTEHNLLMNTSNYVIDQTVNLLTAGNVFYYEIQKEKAGDPLKSLIALKRQESPPKYIPSSYQTEFKQLLSYKRKLMTAINFYVASTEEGDPTLDYTKELQEQASSVIFSSLQSGLVLYEKINLLMSHLMQKQQNNIAIFQFFAIALSLVFLFIAGLVGYVLNRALKSSFSTIVSVTQKISEGNFDVDLNEAADDNVGRLCKAINTMKDKIKYFLDKEKREVIKLQDEIERRIIAEEKNVYLARHDPLTDLPNRLAFQEAFDREIYRAKRFNRQLAFVLFDIDFFKTINDGHGHDVGDLLLKQAAARLKHFCRKEDFVARFGGDEFAILLTDISGPADADVFARKLLGVFKEPFDLLNKEITVSISVGITTYPESGVEYSDIYKHADVALYQTKHAGRNGYRFFSEEYNKQFQYRLELEIALRASIANHELFLVYQPIVNMQTRKILGAEVLLRWQHPTKGLISPVEFIPIAESSGLIIEIGKWVILQVYRQIEQWNGDDHFKNFYITINISPYQLKDDRTVQQIIESRNQSGLKSLIQVNLELTESSIIKNLDDISSNIQLLTSNEFKILVDDFGTGSSTLERLGELPVSTLKIDKSFIDQLSEKEQNKKIVKMIIVLAKTLGLNTIAEGVETEEQMNFLIKNKCLIAQGYYFFKPMKAEKLTDLIMVQE